MTANPARQKTRARDGDRQAQHKKQNGAPARRDSRIPGVAIIDREIEWCLEHTSTNLSNDFQKGFVAGLQQAKELLKKQSRHRHEWLYFDSFHRHCTRCGVNQTWGIAK